MRRFKPIVLGIDDREFPYIWFVSLHPLANKERNSTKVLLYNKLHTTGYRLHISFRDRFVNSSPIERTSSFDCIKDDLCFKIAMSNSWV